MNTPPETGRPETRGMYLTERQVAGRFAVATATIRRWVRAARFPPAVRIVGTTRWRLSDIEAFESALPTICPTLPREPDKSRRAASLDDLDLSAALSAAVRGNLPTVQEDKS